MFTALTRAGHAAVALASLAALGLAVTPAARADAPFVINTLNPADVTFSATGAKGAQATPVTLLAADGSNTASLTGSATLPVSDGTALGFSGATFGTTVVGFTAANATSPLTLTFTKPVTEFGFYIADGSGGAAPAGVFTFTITGSDGTVTPLTAAFTGESPLFFGAQRSLNIPTVTIKSIAITEALTTGSVGSQSFFLGPVKAPTAAPEPSQSAALGLGVLGLAVLAIKARRGKATAV